MNKRKHFLLSEEESSKCIVECKADSLKSKGVLYDFFKSKKLKPEELQAGLKPGHTVWLPKGMELLENDNMVSGFTFRPSANRDGPKEWFGYAKCKIHKNEPPARVYCLLEDFVPGREIKFTVDAWKCTKCEKDVKAPVIEKTKKRKLNLENHFERTRNEPATSTQHSNTGLNSPKSFSIDNESFALRVGNESFLDRFERDLINSIVIEFENVRDSELSENWINSLPILADRLKKRIDEIAQSSVDEDEQMQEVFEDYSETIVSLPECVISPAPSLDHFEAVSIVQNAFKTQDAQNDGSQ